MHITFVKKILENGELCHKCREVSKRLQAEGLVDKIDHIAIADMRDADSEGVRLAQQHGIERAPFFLVEDVAGDVAVFDVYFKFQKFMASQGLAKPLRSSL
ncbi:MAG: hypothetical protein KJP04_03745 [Arenicella sp.]|nr:hypothetical protein [Arenicella sp.]